MCDNTDCVKMEGVYIDNDHCLQVVVPISQEKWTIYGINKCNDKEGEDVYWTASAKMSDVEQSNNAIIESTDIDNGNKINVVIEDEAVKWPSGKKWTKIQYSYGQLQLLAGSRKPLMFTTLATHLLMNFFEFFTRKLMKKK